MRVPDNNITSPNAKNDKEIGDQMVFKKILIIDDEAPIRLLLKTVLEREGFKIITASNGKEGMDLFSKESIDLVVTDLIMPEKEGIQIIREFKKNNPNLPVIAISGGGLSRPANYLSIAKLLGAYATFEKPVEKNELISAVKKALKN